MSVAGTIEAPEDAFVLLEYANPPGGTKYCHNTKLARCELTLTDRVTGQTEVAPQRPRRPIRNPRRPRSPVAS